eukprot:7511808-Alexandrium_andersonii.AAC.1
MAPAAAGATASEQRVFVRRRRPPRSLRRQWRDKRAELAEQMRQQEHDKYAEPSGEFNWFRASAMASSCQ